MVSCSGKMLYLFVIYPFLAVSGPFKADVFMVWFIGSRLAGML